MIDLSSNLQLLACPECGGMLKEGSGTPSLPFAACVDVREIACTSCARPFAIADGVYVLWSDELRSAYESSSDAESERESSVAAKRANVEVYKSIAEDYDHSSGSGLPYHEGVRLLLAHAVDAFVGPRRPSIRVDVGCAGGESLGILANAFERTVGIDASWENVRRAARNGYFAVLADAERLPFARSAVSVISCTGALHHLPRPEAFFISAAEKLEDGGVILTAFDPSSDQAMMRWPARLIWRMRLPAYRLLGRRRRRGYLHADSRIQELNALAEVHRSTGFAPQWLVGALAEAGFVDVQLFYGVDLGGARKRVLPPLQTIVLKILSGQNPFNPSVGAHLGAMATVRTVEHLASVSVEPGADE